MTQTKTASFEYDLNDMSLSDEQELAAFACLRENHPAYWDGKSQLWIISRHNDIQRMLKQPELYSSEAKGPWHLFETKFSMQAQDGPKHDAVRHTVSLGFRPRSIRQLASSVLAFTDAAIDNVAEQGHCDLVESLAVPIPTAVIAELLGFDEQGSIDLFRRWGDAVFGSAEWGEEQIQICEQFQDYVKTVVEQRRANPRDDLLSEIVSAGDKVNAGLSEGEFDILEPFYRDPIPGMPVGDGIMGFIAFLVLAGSETTRHAISRGMHFLIEHPEQRKKLHDNPELIDLAVEEILRYTSIVRTMRRTVMQDTELHGKQLKQGDSVVFLFRSANMDTNVFSNPNEFIIDRTPNDHIAFGWGSHFCLGSNLAKLEIKVAISRLLERLPDIRLAENAVIEDNANPIVSGLSTMPVVFTPVARSC